MSVHVSSEMGEDKVVEWTTHPQLVYQVWENAMLATETNVGSHANDIAAAAGILSEDKDSKELLNCHAVIAKDARKARLGMEGKDGGEIVEVPYVGIL